MPLSDQCVCRQAVGMMIGSEVDSECPIHGVDRELRVQSVDAARRAMDDELRMDPLATRDGFTADGAARVLTTCGQSELREEFIVCHAAGYPDPFWPHPNTLEKAREFMLSHTHNGVTGEPTHPFIQRRLVSDWEVVDRVE